MNLRPAMGSRRRFFLPLLILAAAAPATQPTPPLLAEAHHVLATMHESQYTHKTAIDESARSYHCDCSGLLDYLLNRTSPSLYRLLPHPKGKRPLAVHFYQAFTTAPLAGTQRVPGPSPTWQRIPSLKDALPGDILAWRRPILTPGQDTGHVLLLDSAPTPDGPNVFKVTIIDSTKSPHANDTRPPGQTGIGRGTLWFQTDDSGAPTGFRWKSNGTKFTPLPIAIARPLFPSTPGHSFGRSSDRSAAPDSSPPATKSFPHAPAPAQNPPAPAAPSSPTSP